ncbi:hypothetical protein BGZ73_006097 [Actinomortierella ambigua]|nr:hypothetical protein BGZ73_006097 [Actinomortierella ambigua]
MKYMQRLDFDFRRDPPAAIAIDLIEQCPQLKRLRIETENLYPFRYLPPLLRRKEISPKDKSDDNNQEERTVDDTDGLEEEGESDNEDGDDGGVVAVVKHDKHGDSIGYRPRSRDKTKRSQGCCPELHTLELEVCCEWVTTPTESETAALAQATMSSCRNLTLRGCAILDSLTENLLANGRWTRRLVTLDVIRSKNAQPLVLGVLEGCPSLQVLRASKLTLTSFIAWTDDRDPWMDGKPWVCLGLREWSVAVTGIERNHMRDGQADSGEAVRRRSGAVAGDDEDAFEYDDDEYGGEDMEDYEGREGDESVDNEDLEGDEEEEKTEEHEREQQQ